MPTNYCAAIWSLKGASYQLGVQTSHLSVTPPQSSCINLWISMVIPEGTQRHEKAQVL